MNNLQRVEVALGKLNDGLERFFTKFFFLIVLMNPMGILKLGSSRDEGETTNVQCPILPILKVSDR